MITMTSTTKDIIIAALSNPNFFDTKQSPSQKIDQVANLIARVESTVENK